MTSTCVCYDKGINAKTLAIIFIIRNMLSKSFKKLKDDERLYLLLLRARQHFLLWRQISLEVCHQIFYLHGYVQLSDAKLDWLWKKNKTCLKCYCDFSNNKKNLTTVFFFFFLHTIPNMSPLRKTNKIRTS